MNYDHAFHAGNHGDVLKHVVLLGLLEALARKPTPFFVLDTHAGQGRYELGSEAALRSGESAGGVHRFRDLAPDAAPDALARWLRAIAPHLAEGFYPGSPTLIADRLREHDRLACCELQADAAGRLKGLLRSNPRVGVHQRDGYAAIKALLPPDERRGLVLVDPPYEDRLAEFDRALPALRTGLERWPTGLFALWYPIKVQRQLQAFYRRAAALPAQTAWTVELLVRPADSPLRMNGSGVLVLNPPWRLDQALEATLPQLARALADGEASWRLEWLRRE